MSEEVLRKLPVGISDWRGIYTTDKFFVDKTQKLLELVTDKTKVFLSRPRRMGKSTLVSMLKDLFTNGDKNFEGTAIYGQWPQEERYPVITLDFMEIEGDENANGDEPSAWAYKESFKKSLRYALAFAFQNAGFPEAQEFNKNAPDLDYFLKSLAQIAHKHRLVILIDEWDFPLSSNLDNEKIFNATLTVLRTFYKWLRNLEDPRFVLVTGVRC